MYYADIMRGRSDFSFRRSGIHSIHDEEIRDKKGGVEIVS
jgi:hypothetical protein